MYIDEDDFVVMYLFLDDITNDVLIQFFIRFQDRIEQFQVIVFYQSERDILLTPDPQRKYWGGVYLMVQYVPQMKNDINNAFTSFVSKTFGDPRLLLTSKSINIYNSLSLITKISSIFTVSEQLSLLLNMELHSPSGNIFILN